MTWCKISVITISAFVCLSCLVSTAFSGGKNSTGDSFVGVYEHKIEGMYSGRIEIKHDGTSYLMDATSESNVSGSNFLCFFTARPQKRLVGSQAVVAGKAVVFKSDEYGDVRSQPPIITVVFGNQELQVTASNIFSQPYCGMNGSIGTGKYIKIK